MKNNEDSIYQLITDLCLKFTAHKDVKKIRTKCYEIILGKKYPQLSDNEVLRKDPMIDLIWWKMMLVENRLPDWARDLSNAVDVAQEAYGENQYDFKHILEFLLTLKREPIGDSHKLDLWALPDILEDLNFMKQFELPQSLKVEWEKNQEYTLMKNHIFITCGSKRSVRLPTTVNSGTTIETDPDMIHQQNPPSIDLSFSKTLIDEGYISPEENIWKLATTLPVYKRRTWEALGILEPEKELPFLSELGDLQSLWIDNLPFLYYSDKTRHENVLKYTMKTKRTFIKDVKYLLVGMSSDSFCVNKNGEFYIMPSISIEGITPMSLQTYCQDLLFAGTCYKALSNLSTPNPATGKYEFQGYIITEFYKSIGRYLQFYNTAIMGIPDDIAILMLHDRTHIVRTQIITLASICKIGPFAEDTFIPHGVALLNYLYKTVLAISDRNVLMVLYSILYPCCQVYFNRFLSQWILEGIINDPYGEFFIQVNVKYLPTRGRTYWTRSVSFRDDIVPDFLTDFKDDIFYCGKLMNLLKLCDQDSKLCVYLSGNKPPIITCCLTCEHLAELKQSTMNYYLEVCSDCGGIFDLEEYLDRCEGPDPVLLNLIAKKRSVTLKKLELERKRTDMIVNEKQQEEFQMLKEQYDIALEMKQLHVAKEVEREMKMLQKNASLEQKRQDLIDKESTKLIEYYSNLCADSELKLQKMANNNKALKAILIEGELDKVSVTSDEIKVVKIASNFTINDSESNLTFSVKDTSVVNEKPEVDIQKKTSTVNKDLDELNANKIVDATTSPKSDKERYDESIHKTINILEVAKNIKKKVMTEEMGLINNEPLKKSPLLTPQMMEARRNKVKILSAEFGIDIRTEDVVKSRPMTSLQINRNKMMMTSPNCYGMQYNDNEDQANKNIPESKIDVMKKSKSLTLDLQKSKETEKPTPMSVDSTPLSDVIPASGLHTPASTILDSIPTTSETRQTDDGGFDFSVEPEIKLPTVEITTRSFSKLITKQEAANIFTNCTKIFIIDSIMEPLKAQTKLANSELMKLFIEKLQFLNHLNTLRNYFFMQDGEFGRNMTENLFEKLYEISSKRNQKMLRDCPLKLTTYLKVPI
ncbi:uncharacterized protein LOC109608350 isoform X2 [Aethina tumida]|uniref:uncharacterized protein LOC109608350 isoform X2 n=1 Tax=Aethina tumida TaxID=116153 RepID=UPI002147E231|nr:uncharacterized protein LOC109608350 isoform X2 [Aethina tumida]